ncbi:cation:dicarboxylate symporter family transporter [Thermodesulfobacteriota bacterium]
METNKKEKKKLSLSSQILIGMALGILAGIFLGEYCAFLQIIGDAFIQLLQMTILPYITFSMIVGIGGLTLNKAKMLAKKAGVLMLLFWAISLIIVLLLPLTFPKWESAAFFSSSIAEIPPKVDFLSLYIPANPFFSLANNIVPAVVLFSILMGIGLMGMENKDLLLKPIAVASQVMIKMTNMIVNLMPIGVFAVTAAATGTMSIEEFGRLQVYVVSFNVAALLLTFWILPMLVTPLTPFKYRDIFRLTRDALVTAFATSNLFIVLTVLTENCKELFRTYDLQEENTDAYVDVIIPISFNFPNTGKLLMLVFILFAAWFTGSTFSTMQYPTFVFSGLLSFFGGVDIAMPFMLDLMRLPTDMYQLYMVTGILTGRFATLLAAMNLVIFTLLATASLTGVMTVSKEKLTRYVVTTVLLTFAVIGVTRGYFSLAVKNVYNRDYVIGNMQSLIFPVPREVYKSVDESVRKVDPRKPVLQRIRETEVLRVGYDPEGLPYTYFSEIGELVGFDVDMAQLLARELGVKLEFIPVEIETMDKLLNTGQVDLVMSGIPVTTPRLEKMTFSSPYMENTVSFIVPDHRRSEFASSKAIQRIPKLKVGITHGSDYFADKIRNYLPNVEIVEVGSIREFFETNKSGVDALVMDAESGSAWSLMYPRFQPVVPVPDVAKLPVAYPVAGGDREFADFMSQWIQLKKSGLEFDMLYDYWILGQDAEPKQPRWSVIRNVLKWVE